MPVNLNSVLLQNYVEQLELFSKSSLVSSEINTRTKLIDPLLELLGWNVRSADVALEYPVKLGRGFGHVDYALLQKNRPVVFVEAKPYNSTLIEDYSDQIISYCLSGRVRWSALTNGRFVKIFDSSRDSQERDTLICEIDLSKPTDFIEELSILHKDSVDSGEIEEISKKIIGHRKAIMNIKNSRNELSTGFSETIRKIAGNFNPEKIDIISSQLANTTIDLLEKGNGVNLHYPRARSSEGLPIFSNIKKQDYDATWINRRKIIYQGKEYSSISKLSSEISGSSRNGWKDWKYIDENGKTMSINELRK